MLKDFFRQNDPVIEFDEAQLVAHAQASNALMNVLYRPDKWPAGTHASTSATATPAAIGAVVPTMPRKLQNWSFKNVSLSKTHIEGVTFSECEFEDCLFIATTFSNVDFHRCRFINCNFYKSKFVDAYIDPKSFYFGLGVWWKYSNIGVGLFQQLYENSSKSRQVDFQASADFKFRKWQRWQLRFDKKSGKINSLQLIFKMFASIVSEWVTGFGYRPFRFIATTLLFFTTMSALNMHFLVGALKTDAGVIDHMSFPDAIFYTYSLMSALGFSTILPITSFAKILAVSEGLCGIGWLGIFTSLLVKRFIR